MYKNQELADEVAAKLKEVPGLLDALHNHQDQAWEYRGVCNNWRMVKYEEGDTFAAHVDQSDQFQVRNTNGSKDMVASFHTLLISLSLNGAYEGGATRFYPAGTYDGRIVDVYVPRGWGLVFKQAGVLHSGQPVRMGTKYVAQAGILKLVPLGQTFKPSQFRLGPGLQDHLEHILAEQGPPLSGR